MNKQEHGFKQPNFGQGLLVKEYLTAFYRQTLYGRTGWNKSIWLIAGQASRAYQIFGD